MVDFEHDGILAFRVQGSRIYDPLPFSLLGSGGIRSCIRIDQLSGWPEIGGVFFDACEESGFIGVVTCWSLDHLNKLMGKVL